jgi:hypothetical protein
LRVDEAVASVDEAVTWELLMSVAAPGGVRPASRRDEQLVVVRA